MTGHAEWITYLEPDAAVQWGLNPVLLGSLARAGIPVVPAFAISTQSVQAMLLDPKVRAKAEQIANDHDYANPQHFAGVSKDLQKLIAKLTFGKSLSAEIELLLNSLRHAVTLGATKEIRLSVRYCTVSGENLIPAHTGIVKTVTQLESLIKELLAPLFESKTLHTRIAEKGVLLPEPGSILVEYADHAQASGQAQCFDPLEYDAKTIYITAHANEDPTTHPASQDVYRFDRSSLLPLSASHGLHRWRQTRDGKHVSKSSANHHKGILSDSEQLQLARIARSGQQISAEPICLAWVRTKHQFLVVGASPITDSMPQDHQEPSHVPIALGVSANLGRVRGRAVVVREKSDYNQVARGDIVVLKHLVESDKKRLFDVAGIIIETGHAVGKESVLAQSLGVPALAGAHSATTMIKTGQLITLDATHGAVYAGSIEENTPFIPQKPITGTRISLLLTDPLSVNQGLLTEVDGIALIRGEFLLELAGTHPQELISKGRLEEYKEILGDVVGRIAELAFPKTVVYQFHDIHGDSVVHTIAHPNRHEPNPKLGMRGTRRLLHEQELFLAELGVITSLRDRGLTNVEAMLPMVRSISEYDEALRTIDRQLEKSVSAPPIWVRCETPALAIVAEELASREPHGVCFDVPALAQLITGTDGHNYQVAHHLDQADQAVLDALSYAIATLSVAGVHTAILAEGEELRPEVIATAVRSGVSEVAVHRSDVDAVRRMVASIEQLLLVEHARSIVSDSAHSAASSLE